MSASREVQSFNMTCHESIDLMETQICTLLKCDPGRVACEFQSSGYLDIRNQILRHIQVKDKNC